MVIAVHAAQISFFKILIIYNKWAAPLITMKNGEMTASAYIKSAGQTTTTHLPSCETDFNEHSDLGLPAPDNRQCRHGSVANFTSIQSLVWYVWPDLPARLQAAE